LQNWRLYESKRTHQNDLQDYKKYLKIYYKLYKDNQCEITPSYSDIGRIESILISLILRQEKEAIISKYLKFESERLFRFFFIIVIKQIPENLIIYSKT